MKSADISKLNWVADHFWFQGETKGKNANVTYSIQEHRYLMCIPRSQDSCSNVEV